MTSRCAGLSTSGSSDTDGVVVRITVRADRVATGRVAVVTRRTVVVRVRSAAGATTRRGASAGAAGSTYCGSVNFGAPGRIFQRRRRKSAHARLGRQDAPAHRRAVRALGDDGLDRLGGDLTGDGR